ncbi:MAG: thioredoxin family protein [Hydrogenothermaceae bacterium]|nr:thioredoxin family protein [Hydrogenothermaceae bacterium]
MVKVLVDLESDKSVLDLMDKVKKEVDFEIEEKEFSKLKPAIGILDKNGKIRVTFLGVPKFEGLVESIKIFSSGNYHLTERVLNFLDMIDKPVDIKVFTTQGCGWCYPAIIKAVSFAYLSEFINVSIYDCYSFPDLATSYNVITVPKTVINDKIEFVGTKDDNEFLGYILTAIKE